MRAGMVDPSHLPAGLGCWWWMRLSGCRCRGHGRGEIGIRDAGHAIALERATLTPFSGKALCCTNDERVTRSSFSDRLQRISAPRPLSLLPTRIWSDEEWERIQLGCCSRDMDEKWDVFAEERSSSCTGAGRAMGSSRPSLVPSMTVAGGLPRPWWNVIRTAIGARTTSTTA